MPNTKHSHDEEAANHHKATAKATVMPIQSIQQVMTKKAHEAEGHAQNARTQTKQLQKSMLIRVSSKKVMDYNYRSVKRIRLMVYLFCF
jgi:hypothetical protein